MEKVPAIERKTDHATAVAFHVGNRTGNASPSENRRCGMAPNSRVLVTPDSRTLLGDVKPAQTVSFRFPKKNPHAKQSVEAIELPKAQVRLNFDGERTIGEYWH